MMKQNLLALGSVLVSLMASAPSQASVRDSAYTALSGANCVETTNEEEGAEYSAECVGYGAYRVRVSDFDLRMELTLVHPQGQESSLNLFELLGGRFNSIGETLEWRGARLKSGAIKPDSVIFRVRFPLGPDGSDYRGNALFVAKVGADSKETCIIGAINARKPNGNLRARRLADASGKASCGNRDLEAMKRALQD
jgi:hypothetical protein